MISLVAGLPGVGKSLFGYFLAAKASLTGAVIYSTVEESLRKTARARLEAAGARLDRVYFMTPELPEDTQRLRAEIEQHHASLVVLDPIAAHLSVSISVDQDVRRALTPLKHVAEDSNAAIVLVSPTIKRPPAGGHPMDAIGGAGGGLRASARVAYLLGKNPQDPDEILLVAVKSNLGPEPATFAFELDEHHFDDVGNIASHRVSTRDPKAHLRSVAELATEWGVHRNTIHALVRRGELRSVRIGRRVRFRPEDIEAYLSRRTP